MAPRPLPGEGVAAGRPRRRRPPGAQALAAGALLHAGRRGGPGAGGWLAGCQPNGGRPAGRDAAMLARRAARGGRAEAVRREGLREGSGAGSGDPTRVPFTSALIPGSQAVRRGKGVVAAAPQRCEPGRGPRSPLAQGASDRGQPARGSVRAVAELGSISLLGLFQTTGRRQLPGSLPSTQWCFPRARRQTLPKNSLKSSCFC